MTNAADTSPQPPEARSAWLGWVFTAALVAYASGIHHGLGPPPQGVPAHWYEPSAFLTHVDRLDFAFASVPRLFTCFTAPAALLAVGAFVWGRSAVARALALTCVAAVVLFVFYGELAPDVWKFFGWRGSAVIWLTAACAGFSAAAPFLAASWLRLRWPLRLACYLPVVFGVIAFIRNATGTNAELKYSISPWPAVPVFGLEVAALFVVSVLAGASLLCGVGILILGRRDGLARAARAIALGALLVGAPLLVGEGWARWDYTVTREHRARVIIEALQRFEERESLFPDSLDALVAAGDLDAVPKPAIGFAALGDQTFRYQSFGSSFLLEFEAPRWVECAYTPAYDDEEADDDSQGESLAESWSCPSEPPELW